ncbi:MAG: hypothetical protein WBA17_11315 [Saprospiraceae bacterium]
MSTSSSNKPIKLKIVVSYAKIDYRTVKNIVDQCIKVSYFSYGNYRFKAEVWWDVDLQGGRGWNGQILLEFKDADIIIFMLTPNLLLSKYITACEIPLAMERYRDSGITILGILVKDCDYMSTDLQEIQMIPRKHSKLKAYSKFRPRNNALKLIRYGVNITMVKSHLNIPHIDLDILNEFDRKIDIEQFKSKRDSKNYKFVKKRRQKRRVSVKTRIKRYYKKLLRRHYRRTIVILILITCIIFMVKCS